MSGGFGDSVFGGVSIAPTLAVQIVGVVTAGSVGSLATSVTKPLLVGAAAVASAGTPVFSGQVAISGLSGQAQLGTPFSAIQTSAIKGVSAKAVADDVLKFEVIPPIGLAGFTDFIRREPDDYWPPLTRLLPRGIAWPRDPDTVLQKTVRGLAQIWGFVDKRAADLLEIEGDPRKTIEMLPDWEENFGLPEPCLPEPQTEELRRKVLVWKMTLMGGQSRQWFYQFSREIVGTKIYIQEFAPFTCGRSQVGDTRPGPEAGWEEDHFQWEIGHPEMRFFWRVRPLGKTLHPFRCGRDNCGEDPLCRITPDVALECMLIKLKPAHTDIVFDYSLSTIE